MGYGSLIETTGDNSAEINWNYKATDWLEVGVNKWWKNILDPMNNGKFTMALKGHFEKKLQYAMKMNGKWDTITDIAINDATMYFNHESGNKTVGAEMKFNNTEGSKGFDC